MTDTMASQNIDLSASDILYVRIFRFLIGKFIFSTGSFGSLDDVRIRVRYGKVRKKIP
jgi:hypothetical protein